jgi:hypothetical protein
LETLSATKAFSFSVEEALKTGFYVSGTPGSGKSDIAMMCADELRKAGVIVMVWDPSQDWLERYPINYVVTFKNPPYALEDVQLKDCIFDTSTLTVLQMQEAADRFCWLLYNYQARKTKEERKQFFIIFEEAQVMIPQGVMRAKRLQNIARVITVGRNYKIRVGLITQFAATVDKDALKSAKERWFGWTDEKNDTDYIGSIVGEEEAKGLRYYSPGEFLFNFPSKNILEKIKIEPYK